MDERQLMQRVPMLREAADKWHYHWLEIALVHASISKDPRTKVGAVIVGPDNEVRSMGFNGLPRGLADTKARLENKAEKLRLIVHAEMNAVLNAARIGVSTRGCTLYLACTNDQGDVWSGPPCTRCAVELIQAGIKRIVHFPFKRQVSGWTEDVYAAGRILDEVGVERVERILPPKLVKYQMTPDQLAAMSENWDKIDPSFRPALQPAVDLQTD